MATIFKRNNTWYISYILNDKRIKQSLKVKSKILAEKERVRVETEIEKGLLGLAAKRIKPADALKEFTEEIIQTKSAPTSRRYKYLLRPLKIYFEDRETIKLLKDVQRSDIENVLRKRDLEVKAKTYNEEIALIKRFFVWCVDRSYIFVNPTLKIPRKHMTPPPPRAFTKREIELILTNANDCHRDIYEFLLNTGLRLGEMANLEWTDIDFENKQINIRIKKGWKPKTSTNRIIPLTMRSEQILKSQSKTSNYVFITKNGGLHNDIYNRFRYLLLKIKNKCGVDIQDANIHTFRHTFATYCLMNGIDIYTVSRYLGHTSVKMTEKYLTLLPDYAKKEIEKLKY